MEQISRFKFLPWLGFEPRTSHLAVQHATTCLLGLILAALYVQALLPVAVILFGCSSFILVFALTDVAETLSYLLVGTSDKGRTTSTPEVSSEFYVLNLPGLS